MKKILLLLICLPTIVLGQLTYIPDDNFEQLLISLGYDNNLDDYVLTSQIENIDSLTLNYINDLTGLEDFINLVFVELGNINVPINLNNSINLEVVHLNDINFKLISMENCTEISTLRIENDSFDYFSPEDSLRSDFFQPFVNLNHLSVSYVSLSTLDLSNNTQLETLSYGSLQSPLYDGDFNLNISFLPNLNNLYLFSPNYHSNSEQTSYEITFGYHPNLESIYFWKTNFQDVLDFNNCCPNLKYFTTRENKSEWYADFSTLASLEDVKFKNNSNIYYSKLDFSNNPLLNYFSIINDPTTANVTNKIDTLILSNNYFIEFLYVPNADLKYIDLRNGNNENLAVGYNEPNFSSNSNLNCVNVDNFKYSFLNWPLIDNISVYSENCFGDYPVTFNCINNSCIDPMDGSGEFEAYAQCNYICNPQVSFDCINDACVDPLDGGGEFSTLSECEEVCQNISSLNEISFDIRIYPNPSSDIFNIELNSDSETEILVTNILGEKVYNESIKSIGEYNTQIDLSNYSKGIYNLTIKTSKGISNHKLILQ